MWPETYTIGHNERVLYRAAFVVLAVAGCEARLGPGGPIDAIAVDSPEYRDAGIDAPVDARPCEGGDMARMAPDGSCLVFVASPLTYVQAKAACAAMDAHLAFLKSAAVDAVAEDLVGTTDTWIGLTDLAVEGSFVWDDGTPLQYSNWHAGEPNDGGNDPIAEDCVIIAGARTGKGWDDRPCDPSEYPTSGMFAYLCHY